MDKRDLEYSIDKLKQDVDAAIEQAYLDGYNAGSATDKPTQQEFDEAHKLPISYGEDGENYVMAGNLSHPRAIHTLKTLFDKEMFDYESVQELDDHMTYTKIAYIPEDISSEPGYCYRGDGSGVYNAWVWTA